MESEMKMTIARYGMLAILTSGMIALAASSDGDAGDDRMALGTSKVIGFGTVDANGNGHGGIASVPCGDSSMTQSSSQTILPGHTIQCQNAAGVPANNGLARSFAITADTRICAVEFGIESNDGVGPWPIAVRLYEGAITEPFADLELRGQSSVVIPPNVSQQFFTATFDPPVEFVAGEALVVELFIAARVVSAGGDGGKIYIGSNNLPETAPSYLRAPTCNIQNFATYASLNQPQVRIVMTVFTGDHFEPTPGACCLEETGTPCPGDIAQNGQVDVFDLLALLSAWGPCANPSNCPADIAANGVVDIFDLLALLSAWGACPEGSAGGCQQLSLAQCLAANGQFQGAGTSCGAQGICAEPLGACCFGLGVCQNLTLFDCGQAGGQYNGNFTNCSTSTCDQGPACPPGAFNEPEPCGGNVNSGCATVPAGGYTPIACGQTVCGTAWAHNNARDTDWYTVTFNQQTELTWSVNAPFPSQVAIINDQCGAGLVEIANGILDINNPSVKTATACVPPGTYRLFVAPDVFQGHPCGGGTNNYTAQLSCGPCKLPEQDGSSCELAVPVAVGATAIADSTGNDKVALPACIPFLEPNSGVAWFSVVGNGSQLTAFNANLPSTVGQTAMFVYCGSCETPGCIGNQTGNPEGGPGMAWQWCSEPGATYYIAMWGDQLQEGDISLKVITSGSCTPAPCEITGLCAGVCGGQSTFGCWCDESCKVLGDCCPGICSDCPQTGFCPPPPGPCAGFCGEFSPFGCACDELCDLFGDCCVDACIECPDLPHCGPPVPSCSGQCGGGYPAGCFPFGCICYCDDSCQDFGDCCDDVCIECPALPHCP
jgi:hypothetical protein